MSVLLDQSVLNLIRVQVEVQPDAVALEHGTQQLSYRDLDRLSNRVANRLLSLGMQHEEIVPLLIEKSFGFVIAALGVLKAGGTYIPMDPKMPDQRIDFTLSDSGARRLLVSEELFPRCKRGDLGMIVIDENLTSFTKDADTDPKLESDPRRRAYIIYTSGSTGKPKGVEIEHHSLSNLIDVYHQRFGMTSQDRVTLTANISFDVSVGDLWPALAAGATVLIPPKDLFDKLEVHRVVSWVAESRASIAFLPTAMMPLLMESEWPDQMPLRYIITGGDTLRCRPKPHHRFKVINGYGPTENTVWSTFSTVSTEGTGLPPICCAINNVFTYILDSDLKPVHPGDAGELYLGGEQVARGYFNRVELTSEKFIPDPFSCIAESRMYNTGDWPGFCPMGKSISWGVGTIKSRSGECESNSGRLMPHCSRIPGCSSRAAAPY